MPRNLPFPFDLPLSSILKEVRFSGIVTIISIATGEPFVDESSAGEISHSPPKRKSEIVKDQLRAEEVTPSDIDKAEGDVEKDGNGDDGLSVLSQRITVLENPSSYTRAVTRWRKL